MAEIKETHVVQTTPTETRSRATPWLAFLAGALLIGVVALFFMNARGTITTPGGTAELNIESPVAPANR